MGITGSGGDSRGDFQGVRVGGLPGDSRPKKKGGSYDPPRGNPGSDSGQDFFLGRPPFRPFSLAAVALAAEVDRPPILPPTRPDSSADRSRDRRSSASNFFIDPIQVRRDFRVVISFRYRGGRIAGGDTPFSRPWIRNLISFWILETDNVMIFSPFVFRLAGVGK